MIRLDFEEYAIELVNESSYSMGSVDNIFEYAFIYRDKETEFYQSTRHGIKIYKESRLYNSAIVCAAGGATGVHETSTVIIDQEILICCANKIFSLSLPNLELNWVQKADDATCFGIYKTEKGIFIHGELNVSQIDKNSVIIWSAGFADILVTPDGTNSFSIQEDFIEVTDWQFNKYKINFEGKFI